MSTPILFEDIFDVRALNENGKAFERVNRLHCRGTTFDVDLLVDVNCELFDITAGERINVVLARTLSLDGTPDDGTYNPHMGPSLADSYEYVMHGRVFNVKHIEGQRIEIQASFGGLLFRATGEQAQFESMHIDMTFFLLLRRAGGFE
jgi:DNA-directed RNA polymerase I, II, and III subunit RPABC3